MTDEALRARLSRIQHLLKTIHHVPLATVNTDGTPHNTPVFMAFDHELMAYWCSNPETQHSQNILKNSHIFMVVFDSASGQGGGLYIKAEAEALIAHDAQFTRAYDALTELKEHTGGVMGPKEMYLRKGPQRLYHARPLQFWVNTSTKDENGAVIYDQRVELSLAQIQAALSEEI